MTPFFSSVSISIKSLEDQIRNQAPEDISKTNLHWLLKLKMPSVNSHGTSSHSVVKQSMSASLPPKKSFLEFQACEQVESSNKPVQGPWWWVACIKCWGNTLVSNRQNPDWKSWQMRGLLTVVKWAGRCWRPFPPLQPASQPQGPLAFWAIPQMSSVAAVQLFTEDLRWINRPQHPLCTVLPQKHLKHFPPTFLQTI